MSGRTVPTKRIEAIMARLGPAARVVALALVDRLADGGFPVERLAIVGRDLEIVAPGRGGVRR
jgi:hypothetical protein